MIKVSINITNKQIKCQSKNSKKITLLIPCHNEEKGLPQVISEIPHNKLRELGYTIEILVIDNNSTDNTSKIAKTLGARVIEEKRQGKGNAVRTGFRSISKDTDFVVMLDGDATYKPSEIPRLIEPLESNFADVIIGSRLEGRMNNNAMSFSHRLANWFFTFITRHFYGANVTDTCTGFFAWNAEVVKNLNGHIKSPGFAIEAEMISKMAKMKYRIHSVPITYAPRHGETKSHLAPFRDGLRITWMLIKNVGWKPEKS